MGRKGQKTGSHCHSLPYSGNHHVDHALQLHLQQKATVNGQQDVAQRSEFP